MLGSLLPWKERSYYPTPTPGRLSRMMNRMEGEMEDLMERFWGGDGGWLTNRWRFLPTIDVAESETHFEVMVDLPGLKPEEVHVELKEGDLWISGKREEKKEEKGKTYHRVERHHGEFRRVLPLPSTIDADQIDAKFESGVLKITIPKTEESKAKHIEVTS